MEVWKKETWKNKKVKICHNDGEKTIEHVKHKDLCLLKVTHWLIEKKNESVSEGPLFDQMTDSTFNFVSSRVHLLTV